MIFFSNHKALYFIGSRVSNLLDEVFKGRRMQHVRFELPNIHLTGWANYCRLVHHRAAGLSVCTYVVRLAVEKDKLWAAGKGEMSMLIRWKSDKLTHNLQRGRKLK